MIYSNTCYCKQYFLLLNILYKVFAKKGWISSFDMIKRNLSSKMRFSKFSNKIQAFSVKAYRKSE